MDTITTEHSEINRTFISPFISDDKSTDVETSGFKPKILIIDDERESAAEILDLLT